MNPDTRRKLFAFRVIELKNVLERLSLPQSGKKADLQNRILGYFGEGSRADQRVEPAREQWKIQAAGESSHLTHKFS